MRLRIAVLVVIAASVLAVTAAPASTPLWRTSTASVFSDSVHACRGYGGYIVAHKSLPCGTRIKFCYRRAHGSLRTVAQPRRATSNAPGGAVLGKGAGGRAGRMLAMAGGVNRLRARADSGAGRSERVQDDAGASGRVRASSGSDSRWFGAGSLVRGSGLREPGAPGTRARHRQPGENSQASVSAGTSNGRYGQASGVSGVRGGAAARRVPLTRCSWARVGDRGPYVGGREFDLDSSLASAIGFPYSVASVRWRRAR